MRFKEFNTAWIHSKIGEICEIEMCKRIFSNQTNTIGGVPFYKVGTIGGKPDTWISENLFNEYKDKYNYPQKGEILITCSGTVGKCIIFNGKDAYFQDSNIVWLANKSTVLDIFLFYIMNNIDWSYLNSTTITRIYGSDLRNLNFYYPNNKNEQQKITDFLSLLDQRIDTQSKIIEKYKSLIKVINQMMCNFDHEKIQVQNVFDFKEKTKHQANMGNSQGNFIYFTNEESTYKYFDSYDFDGEYIIANTGGKANFKYYNGKFAVMSDCLVMECNDNQNTKFYLYSILNRIDYINQVCFVGSGLKHLDKKLFLKTFITKFNKNLEPFINLIILLEKKISNDKILLQKLKEQKKYLLSNMFI